MSGVNIKELNADDAFDVIHFIFEEDMLSAKTKEELDVKSTLRTSLYEQLYGVVYKYSSSGGQSEYARAYVGDALNDIEDDVPTPVDPVQRAGSSGVVKPFTPPTRVDAESPLPFGRGIDAPLG